MVNKKRICVVTGSRAEYGLLRHLMDAIKASEWLSLQLIVTGMHLSPEFGSTYQEIEADGFRIDRKVEMLLSSDTPVGIGKSTGLGTIGMADAIDQLKPDMMLVLGDRFEVLAAVIAALYARIPVAHIHGGETTVGAFDEGIRHAITKMSHLHFVSTEQSRRRVIQLGENPRHVFHVGGLGVDAIRRLDWLSFEEVEQRVGISLSPRFLLITFHPVTLETSTAEQQFRELLAAISKLEDMKCVFTLSNADTDGRVISGLVKEFVGQRSDSAVAHVSLGQRNYLSAAKYAYAVVGNSSSGLLEVPSLGTPTINIGDRQKGRETAPSVISCNATSQEIFHSLTMLEDGSFQESIRAGTNPYERLGTVEEIVKTLETFSINESTVKKCFYDLPAS